MTNLSEWKLAQLVQANGRRGMIIGICIGVLIILAIIIAIVKIVWLKKYFCECDCCGDYDDDFYIEDDDEDDCTYTSEKDFA